MGAIEATVDKALVKRLLRGEQRAFDEFFDGYFPRLYRFALVRTRHDPEAAEEIVQNTLIQVIRKLDTYRGEAALFTWLCTFCRHEISAFYRSRDRRLETVELTEELPEVRAALESLLTTSATDPASVTERRELGRIVQATLDQLHPRYGDALEWKYVHGLTVKEIASRMEVSPKAVESVLSRAREAFRDAFATLGKGWKSSGATSP